MSPEAPRNPTIGATEGGDWSLKTRQRVAGISISYGITIPAVMLRD